MRDLYGDDYESIAGEHSDRLIPEGLRRLTGAAVFVGLVAVMGLWAYRLGTRDAAEVPIIRAMEGPARVQPEDPGGLRAAHQGLEVNAVLAAQTAPAPRAAVPVPDPPALAEEDGPQGELVLATPAPLPDAGEAAGTDLRMPPQEDAPDLLEVAPVPDLTAGLTDLPPQQTDPLAPPTEAAAPRPRGRPAGWVAARARTEPAAATPAPAPAPVQPAAAPAAPAANETAALGTGTRLVQLGAYDSEEITRQAWGRLVARYGDLLASKSLYVERATSNARVFYRLRVAGFTSAEETRVMCESLRARGVDCIPVTLR